MVSSIDKFIQDTGEILNDLPSLTILCTILEIIKQHQAAIEALAFGESSTVILHSASVETAKLAKLIDQLIDPQQVSSL